MQNKFASYVKKTILLPFVIMATVPITALSNDVNDTKAVKLFKIKDLNPIQATGAYQGMAIHGDYMFSLRNKGFCVVINIKDSCIISEFKLGSYCDNNHANVAAFGNEYYSKEDKFPLLYVSQCHSTPIKGCEGTKHLCLVERIICENDKPIGSELVQVINFDNAKGRLWTIESGNAKWLYCYGNTIRNEAPGNRLYVNKFKMPKLDKNRFMITLTQKDIVDSLYYDELVPEGRRGIQNAILQGACVRKGILYFPCGFGSPEHPSELFIIDMKKRKAGYYNYQDEITAEFEDCDFYKEDLIIGCNGKGGPVYSIPLKKLKTKKQNHDTRHHL